MTPPPGRLSPLQVRVLGILATVRSPRVLTGGAALVGFYHPHRETRDLELLCSADAPPLWRRAAMRTRTSKDPPASVAA